MATIRKRSLPSGKVVWQCDYRDQRGKRRSRQFETRRVADAFMVQARSEVAQGIHSVDSDSISFSEAADLWIERAELDGRERSTVDQKTQHKAGLLAVVGDVRLSRLTTPEVERIRDDLLKRHSRPQAKKLLSSLKGILSEAQRQGRVAQNVAQPVSIKIAGRHKKRLKIGEDIPTKAEMTAILKAAEGRWRALLMTAAFTGMRASEIRGLRWANVDFDRRLIKVEERADRYDQIGPPKSETAHREIPLASIVVNALREWRSACPRLKTKGDDPGELALVFPNGKGRVESLANIWNRGLVPAQITAGVVKDTGKTDGEGNPIARAKYGMHALRHFFASWVIQASEQGGLGYPPKKAQVVLGHSTIQMTMDVYGHLFPDDEPDWKAMDRAALNLA